MRKSKKVGLAVSSFAFLGALALACSFMPKQVATASAGSDEVTTFEMLGAGVKYGEDGGLRFGVTVAKDYVDELAVGGEVVLHSSIDKKGGTENGAKVQEWVLSGANSVYVDSQSTNTFYHSIDFSDVSEAQLIEASAVDLTATMWFSVNGEKVAETEKSLTRAMRTIANVAYDKSEKQSELDKYLGTRTTAEAGVKAYAEVTVANGVTSISKFVMPEGFDESAYTGLYANTDGVSSTVLTEAISLDCEKTLGEWETLACFDENNNVYNLPIVYATEAIEDMTEFKKIKSSGSVEGYFILTGNIGSKENASANRAAPGGSSASIFNGVLDGNGYTAYVNIGDYGLFGQLGDGTVKNLKIDVRFANRTKNYTTTIIMGYKVTAKKSFTIENVCITTASCKQAVAGFTLFRDSRDEKLFMKDVIVDFLQSNITSYLTSYTTGFGYGLSRGDKLGVTAPEQYKNVYILSTNSGIKYASCTSSDSAHTPSGMNVWYAANDSALMEEEESLGFASSNQYAKGTVHRFTSRDKMIDDAEYGATKVGNWSVSSSGIVWAD